MANTPEASASVAVAVKLLWQQLRSGERRALARMLSRIEDEDPAVHLIEDELWRVGRMTPRIGVTGPPGAGKSTIVARLVARLRAAGERVAVLAVDPSSPFTGGALLGDRIRMSEHASDAGVFIRSLATRGGGGGLARGTRRAAMACAAAGYDTVIIETAGVGQTEVGIMELADTVLVALVPEAGDVIQGMKAGVLEIADILVVNKSDRPGADRLCSALKESVSGAVARGREPPVLSCAAVHDEGMDELYGALMEHRSWRVENPAPARLATSELATALVELLEHRVRNLVGAGTLLPASLVSDIESGRIGPHEGARLLLQSEIGPLLLRSEQ